MVKLFAPLSGEIMQLSKVPDKVFSSKMAGEGIAIDSIDDIVLAPADGNLALILEGNHAFCMKLDSGILIIVHIGIDTVELKGEGFQRLTGDGVRVKAGEPIIRIDRKKILEKGYSLITPVLITNMNLVREMSCTNLTKVEAGKDIIMSYKI